MKKYVLYRLVTDLLFLACFCVSFAGYGQVTVQPEYSQLANLSFPLQYYANDFSGKRSLPLLWQEFIIRIAQQTQQNQVDLNLLLTVSDFSHCDPNSKHLIEDYKSEYPAIDRFEQAFLGRCSQTQNNCKLNHIKYQCTQRDYSWLRNKAHLQVLDFNGNEAFLRMQNKDHAYSQELLPQGTTIVGIPLNWNGPADLFTDRAKGNLYMTERVLDQNNLSPVDAQQLLRQSIDFEQLIFLQANPWEHTQDTDTIVMFAKHHQTGQIHAFLTQHPDGPVTRRSLASSSYLAGDFLTLGQASNKENGKCSVASQDLFLMGVFVFNRWDDPFNFKSSLRGFELLKNHASQEDFLEAAQNRWSNFNQLYACYQNIATQLNQQAKSIDAYNYQALLRAGFNQQNIHWLTSPGVYSDNQNNDNTYAASYVNGVIINDTYLMPVFPSFDQADVEYGRNEVQIKQAFDVLGSSDIKAMQELKKVFKHVIPVRSDFLSGGAIHCISSCSYQY
ncbi:MAG TPA: hypothetical protein PKC21_06800 [Oligoflexia bacterium]|nr:hypothetical protein [Oligoflexia bacterium]HMR25045.1 hypothetical protein [Oligoflexia bacterium]